jgi:hypothetical protein
VAACAAVAQELSNNTPNCRNILRRDEIKRQAILKLLDTFEIWLQRRLVGLGNE